MDIFTNWHSPTQHQPNSTWVGVSRQNWNNTSPGWLVFKGSNFTWISGISLSSWTKLLPIGGSNFNFLVHFALFGFNFSTRLSPTSSIFCISLEPLSTSFSLCTITATCNLISPFYASSLLATFICLHSLLLFLFVWVVGKCEYHIFVSTLHQYEWSKQSA